MSSIKRTIVAVGLAVIATAVVASGAATANGRPSAQTDVPRGAAYSAYSDANSPAEVRGVRVVRVQTTQGFDWGDAAVGAAATVALGMIVLGSAVLTTTRRRRGGPPATAA